MSMAARRAAGGSMTRRLALLAALACSLVLPPTLAVVPSTPPVAALTLFGPTLVHADHEVAYRGTLSALGVGVPGVWVEVFDNGQWLTDAQTDQRGGFFLTASFARGPHGLVAVAPGLRSDDFPSAPAPMAGVESATLAVTAAVEPSAPRSFTATASSASIRLAWAAPSDDGGAPLLGYTIRRGASDGSGTVAYVPGPGTLALTDTQVASGVLYSYTVAASNALGTGPHAPCAASSLGGTHARNASYSISSDGSAVTTPLSCGTSTLTAKGTYSYAFDSRFADAAYSYNDPDAGCVNKPGNLHDLTLDNGQSPWHDAAKVGEVAFTNPTAACQPSTHTYAVTATCDGMCDLRWRVDDDAYGDNSGSLELDVDGP
jgi:hypothetical protein